MQRFVWLSGLLMLTACSAPAPTTARIDCATDSAHPDCAPACAPGL